jgi:hypothetical protein
VNPETEAKLTFLLARANLHAQNLNADIANASTRIEDMRLRRLAIEAETLKQELEEFVRDYRSNIESAPDVEGPASRAHQQAGE